MTEIIVENPHRLVECMGQLRDSFGRDLWWRGHACSAWTLVPGVHRAGFPDTEVSLTARFIQKVPPRYPDHPPFNDLPGWLFLLQHYRFPTRLLDWTESPLVALYFAVSECPNDNGTVWVLDPFKLNSAQFKRSVLFSEFSSEIHPLFAAVLQMGSNGIQQIAAITSTERNVRMLVQMARFTIHGITEPLEILPSASDFLVKCTIPAASKPAFATFLFDVGIRLSNLFPDLEHLAKDMLGRSYKPA